MKTEHRHELKANELSKVAVKVESFYERHAGSIQWGVIGVAFVLACGIYYWRTTAAVEAAAWNELSQSQSAEDFAQVAANFSGSKAASWAKLREANSYLEIGLRDAFENREKANTDLKKAKDILASLSKTGGPREFRQQVLFAYARSLEMTSDGDLKPAIEAYETLLNEIPDSAFKQEAERRIAALQKPGAKEFYAFFSKQNPKPPELPKPNDKAGSKGASDPLKPLTPGLGDVHKDVFGTGESGLPLLAPPKLPDLTAPSEDKSEGEAKTEKSETKPATKSEEKPAATDSEKKAEDKPATEPEKKAEDKPAAEPEKESADKPAAEEKPAETPADKKPE